MSGESLLRKSFVIIFSFLLIISSIGSTGLIDSERRSGTVVEQGFNWKSQKGSSIKVMLNKHPWVDIIEPKIREFELLTGINVDLSIYPEDQFRAKRIIELVSGVSDIDVFMIMPGNSLEQYYQSGWTDSLDGMISSKELLWPDYDIDDIFSSALKAGTKDGKIYTIPILLETSLLAYNLEIFEKFNLSPPRTMVELEEAAKTIYEGTSGKISGITLRGKKASATSQWVDFLRSFGGDWLINGKSGIGSDEAIEATDYYGRLLRLYGPKSALSNSWYESISIFMQGKAAMVYDASVFKNNYEDPAISEVAGRIGYVSIPAGPAGVFPHVSSWALSIYEKSRNKNAAWLFIQWATSKDISLECLLQGIPSARYSAWDSENFKNNDKTPQWTQASLESYKIATPFWNPPVINVEKFREAVGSAIVASILGENVTAACTVAEIVTNSLLDE
jgi:multiple sugar transport system substrate-binding protein